MKFISLVAAALLVASCAPASPALGRPSPIATQLTLSATPDTVLTTGSTIRVDARLRTSSGESISGELVTFASSSGAMGPATVATDGNGYASTTLTASQATTVSVTNGALVQTVAIGSTTPVITPPFVPTPPTPLPSEVRDIPINSERTQYDGDHATWTFRAAGDVFPTVEYFRWSFGDGETTSSEGDTVRHIYSASGDKVVTVEAVSRVDRTVIGRGRLVIDVRLRLP